MCCLFTTLVLLGPRAAILVWWLVDQERWDLAFSSFWIALVGFLFVPWTTLAWAAVAVNGVEGFDFVIIGLGALADIASYSGGAYGNRDRFSRV